jgi:cobalt-zinc-cadmium efflux system protein
MLGDLMASAGAIAAGLIMLTTGWRYADPLFSLAVAALILPRTYWLLRAALHVLIEGTPAEVDLPKLRDRLARTPGVESVHDLHVWTVTSGFVALSGHLTVVPAVDRDALLVEARNMLRDEFAIGHVTLQVETEAVNARLDQPCLPDCPPCYPAGHPVAAIAPSRKPAVPRL